MNPQQSLKPDICREDFTFIWQTVFFQSSGTRRFPLLKLPVSILEVYTEVKKQQHLITGKSSAFKLLLLHGVLLNLN